MCLWSLSFPVQSRDDASSPEPRRRGNHGDNGVHIKSKIEREKGMKRGRGRTGCHLSTSLLLLKSRYHYKLTHLGDGIWVILAGGEDGVRRISSKEAPSGTPSSSSSAMAATSPGSGSGAPFGPSTLSNRSSARRRASREWSPPRRLRILTRHSPCAHSSYGGERASG